jgi:hypothetical protein
MSQNVEAIIDEQGQRLLRPERFPTVGMILDPARLSEPAPAQDWDRPGEDAAWSHLQQGR